MSKREILIHLSLYVACWKVPSPHWLLTVQLLSVIWLSSVGRSYIFKSMEPCLFNTLIKLTLILDSGSEKCSFLKLLPKSPLFLQLFLHFLKKMPAGTVIEAIMILHLYLTINHAFFNVFLIRLG